MAGGIPAHRWHINDITVVIIWNAFLSRCCDDDNQCNSTDPCMVGTCETTTVGGLAVQMCVDTFVDPAFQCLETLNLPNLTVTVP